MASKKDPRPESVIPKCPIHLDATGKTEWKRITKELHAIGLISNLDMAVLAGYCAAWSRWVRAEKKLKKSGSEVMKAKSGYLQLSPYLTIANKSLDLDIGSQFAFQHLFQIAATGRIRRM